MSEQAKTDLDELEKEIKSPKRGLGRGLDALFGDQEEGVSASAKRTTLDIDQIEPNPTQPRREFDEQPLQELAESIATHGVLQPILVRPIEGQDGKYQIIAGERRWRASQIAQLHEVPVIIREFDDSVTLQIALIENLQREDLNALEEALCFKNLIERFGFSQEKLAAALGKSRSHVANIMRLLNLPEKVQTYVSDGKLSAGHARALLTSKDPEGLAKEVIAKGLSVRETERLASGNVEASSGSASKAKAPGKSADTLALEEEIANVLGMKVSIEAKGTAGTLKIIYKDLDQLDEVVHRLSHYPQQHALPDDLSDLDVD